MANRTAKRTAKTRPEARRPKNLMDGQRTYRDHGKEIRSHAIGALPLLNSLLERTRLREFLRQHLPPEDARTKVDTPRVVLLLLRNLLVSREPVYGVAEWARNYGPEQFDLCPSDVEHLNDDRVGRCLDRVFQTLNSNLIMDVVRHVVEEFDVSLDELHNDSTTISFSGDYPEAGVEQKFGDLLTPAITWGHSKDHRPDLKQLLYILTVSDDGGVPLYFQAESGNVVDDQTHLTTWSLMAQLVQRKDFIYVADCKLATTENLTQIARQGGRLITVLPATRKEDAEFRRRLRERPESLEWREVDRLCNEDGTLRDVIHATGEQHLTKEGFRLVWFHSQAKAETDGQTRARRIQRAIGELTDLQHRLAGPRTRFRRREQVSDAVQAILDNHQVRDVLAVEIGERETESFKQASRGRPTEKSTYTRQVSVRYQLAWQVDLSALEQAAAGDGVFPLITNIDEFSELELLRAYKRQPIIEKRFSQLKTDFHVAPVYLKSVQRIVGLLTIYFFALLLQSLLERELRQAMQSRGIPSIPLYPEGRPCTRPTTRHVIDVFEPIMRHTIISTANPDELELFATELSPIHKQIIDLLGIFPSEYRR